MATKKTSSPTRRKSAIETSSSPTRASRRPPTAATRQERTSTAPLHASESLTEERIRVRAYYLYLQRDGHPGDPLSDWVRAEAELAAGAGEA